MDFLIVNTRYWGERCLALAGALTLLCYWDLGWGSDLASHFRLQYAVLFLVGLAFVLIRKRPIWVLAGLLGLYLNAVEIIPFYRPVSNHAHPPVVWKLKVMQMNLLNRNTAYGQAAAAIDQMNPDILSLQEATPTWLSRLAPTLKKYPYHLTAPELYGTAGRGLYSKFPLLNAHLQMFAPQYSSGPCRNDPAPEPSDNPADSSPQAAGYPVMAGVPECAIKGHYAGAGSIGRECDYDW